MLTSFCVVSQSADALLWTSIAGEAKITKDFNSELDFQFRFDDNFSLLESMLGQFFVEYEADKNLDIGVGYRLSNKRKNDNYFFRNRLFADINYDLKLAKKLDAEFRLRTQHDFDRFNVINDDILPTKRTVLRLRYGLQYKYKKWRPSVSNEWFFNSNSRLFYTYRINVGSSYKLSKRHNIKLEYTFQTQTFTPILNEHIYQIGYKYNIKGKLINH